MTTLLYHTEGGRESPFDAAILRVASNGPVRIVSPYIGMAYLQRILAISPDWRLLSDVEEWLRSVSARERPKAWAFIRDNLEQIHHVPALHAKAVISDHLAMMGSANLTQKGILGRTELGVLLEDPGLVAELCAWFDGLWSSTTPPLVDEASAFVQWLDEEAAQTPAKRQRFALSSDSRRVRARLVKLEVPPPASHNQLDLGRVAQAVIIEDQTHYVSMAAALEAAIDKLTAQGSFTMGQVVSETRKGFARTTVRELYFLLVQHCSNHIRSVYVEETLNRLILSAGRFAQSTHATLPDALAPFDAYLVLLVQQLDFTVPGELPGAVDVERDTGIGERDQVILVSELLDAGFLQLEDRSGELPLYLLDASFDGWEQRFKLFPRAHAAWEAKRRRPAPAVRPAMPREDEDDLAFSDYDLLNEDQLPDVEGDEEIDFALLKKDLAAGASLRVGRAAFEAAKKARRQAQKTQSDLPPKPAHTKPTPARIDAFTAKLVTAVAGGKSFTAPSWHALVATLAEETQSPTEVVSAALDPVSVYPKVLQVGVKGQESQLIVNPALKWEMLLRYPKTRAICERLLKT